MNRTPMITEAEHRAKLDRTAAAGRAEWRAKADALIEVWDARQTTWMFGGWVARMDAAIDAIREDDDAHG